MGSTQKHNCHTIVERYFDDEQYRMRMHEQGHTQSNMEEFDRIAGGSVNHVAAPEEKRYYKDQYTVVQPKQ